MGLRKLCGFCSLHDADGTLPLECQCLSQCISLHSQLYVFPLAYGVCFKSRDIVIFNFKSLLSLLLYLSHPHSEHQFVSVSFVLSRLSSFISHCSFYFVLCDFFHFTWPVLSTVFIYFLSLLSCFIFLIALFFIFHSFLSSTSSLFLQFLLISRLIISIASLNFLSEKL